MLPSSEEIFSIAQNVLDTMVKVESTLDLVLAPAHPTHVTGCIQIIGTWQGAVVLQTTEDFARNAAARMLCLEDDELTAADIQDAMAEITNMIGGNIKSQVPGPSYLLLPSVTTGADNFRLAHAHPVNDITLNVACQPLRILLCEQRARTPR
ncbi:MAG: chemotaxis protein CheX [Pirellulaceae bacterium]|nr:chemotaxis protein CheX [Pirellulaceae bacterium]